jgi:hypothetical protein
METSVRKAVLLAVLLWAPMTLTAGQELERIPVRAGFLPIDDGSYHVVILTDEKNNLVAFCPTGWSEGYIHAQIRNKNQPGAYSNVGCWIASSTDPQKAVIKFRYMGIPDLSVREFNFSAAKVQRMVFEWRTERLFPSPSN